MPTKSPRKSSKSKSPKKAKSPRKSSSGKAKRSRSKSSRKSRQSSGPKKSTYVEMIQTALMTLNEKGGSTRQEMWKFINAKFPEANYKIFLVRLKKYARAGGFLVKHKSKQRFRLDGGFKDGLSRRVKKGMSVA